MPIDYKLKQGRHKNQSLTQREQDFAVLDRVWNKTPSTAQAEVEKDINTAIREVRKSETD